MFTYCAIILVLWAEHSLADKRCLLVSEVGRYYDLNEAFLFERHGEACDCQNPFRICTDCKNGRRNENAILNEAGGSEIQGIKLKSIICIGDDDLIWCLLTII